jgi:peptidoglycan/xylan/chitin deacetylase (PgdA/CDA1 family)
MRAFLGVGAMLLASCATAPSVSSSRPQIAITIDDLPVHGPYPPGVTPLDVSRQMITALKVGHVPATGFVNAVSAHDEATMQVLREWRAAGFVLGNHTWSHPHFSDLSPDRFEEEVTHDEPVLKDLGGGSDWRWFRYPYLDEGKDETQRDAGRQVLAKLGYRVADVTADFSDWAFTSAWARCNAAGDKSGAFLLERTYLDDASESIKVARGTAQALHGRDIPYVLLMHVSAMSAYMMPRIIDLYRKAGFRFVTLERAESDPVYRADIDLSLPGRTPEWKLAQEKGVRLTPSPDSTAKLDAICPQAPAAKSR